MPAAADKKKSWYRPRNLILAGLMVVLGLACWAGYWVWWAYNAEPSVTVDYTENLVELSESYQPEGENAWPLLMRAVAEFEAVEREVEALEFDRVSEYGDAEPLSFSLVTWNEFYPDNIEPERAALKLLEERGAFELLRRAATMPRSVTSTYAEKRLYRLEQDVTGESMEGVVEMQELLKMQYARMRLAADARDFDTLVDVFHQSLIFSAFLSYQPIATSRLVACAVASGAYSNLQKIINETDLPAEVASELRDALAAHDRSAPLELNIEGLRYRLLDLIQRVYTDDGAGGGRFLPSAVQQIRNENAAALQRAFQGAPFQLEGFPVPEPVRRIDNLQTFRFASREEEIRKLDEVLEAMKDVVGDATIDWRAKKSRLDAITESISESHAILTNNLGSISGILKSMAYEDQFETVTRILLGIEEYLAVHGTPPESLDELTPEILASIPADPMSGSSFLYRRLDTPDDLGREFLLYLPGAGGNDNGGTVADYGDFSPWDVLTDPSLGQTYDVVVNDQSFD